VGWAQAISTPGKETEEEAWNAVIPQVVILKDFYEYSLTLGNLPPFHISVSRIFQDEEMELEGPARDIFWPEFLNFSIFFFLSFLCAEQTLPKILHALCSGDPIKNLEVKQATTKQFAEMVHFVLLFDDLKVPFYYYYYY